jgi:hypothetical protein
VGLDRQSATGHAGRMAQAEDKKSAADPRRAREDRLAKALRENLRRRKASGPPSDSDPDQSDPR